MPGPLEIPPRYVVREILRDDDAEFLARADDSVLRREVVLKAPGAALARHIASTGDLERYLAEARTLARIQHPNVVKLLDVVEFPGGFVLVLEPVVGETLTTRVARTGPLSATAVRQLGLRLASALAALHEVGAVHRAIEPDHVLVRTDGEPVLTGFHFAKFIARSGIASSIEYTQTATSATARIPLPSPRYVAPELRQGQVANARSDVFALGATLVFAWTGRDPPHTMPTTDAALAAVLSRCVEHAPLQRIQRAHEVARELAEAHASAAELATHASGTSASATWTRRLLAVGLILGALTTWRALLDDDAADAGERGRSVRVNDATEAYASKYAASHALLIGIGEAYANQGFPALKNAENDIVALRARLEAMPWEQWQITQLVGKDATKQAILDALARLVDTAPDDRVLVYFAGHGERDATDDKSGFLIPADGKPRVAAHDENTWIASDELNGKIRRMRAKHVLLMLDCCYGGVMTRFRSGGDVTAVAPLLTERAHLVIASGRPNERVPDGEGAHSPFLSAVIEALSGPEKTLTATALYARIQAKCAQGNAALPTFAPLEGGGSGDVVFFLRE